jgi:hypothetical protein
MKEVEILTRLAMVARQEPVPQVNAVPGVLAELQTSSEEGRNPLAWIAGFASVAAVPVAVLGFLALESIMNPLLGVFWVLRWTM